MENTEYPSGADGDTADRVIRQAEMRVTEILEEMEQFGEGLELLKLQTGLIDLFRSAGFELSEKRRETAVVLNNNGFSYARLADTLGVSRGRIQQLITGVGAPKRSGVIETEMRVAAGQMRTAGATDTEIIDTLVPKIRGYKSGDRITTRQIAEMLSVDESAVRPVATKVDAEKRQKKHPEPTAG